MMLASEYDGLRAGIASEPASVEFLARRPQPRPATATSTASAEPETRERATDEMQRKEAAEMRARIDMTIAMERVRRISTPILVQGRDRDHNQALFRVNYELLREAGKDVEWKSYDHDEHGFIYIRRNAQGAYEPDPIQAQAVRDAIAYFDRKMKEKPAASEAAK